MTNAQFNQLFFSLGCQMFALLSVRMHVTGSEYLRLMNSLYHQSGDFLNRLIRVHKRLRKKFLVVSPFCHIKRLQLQTGYKFLLFYRSKIGFEAMGTGLESLCLGKFMTPVVLLYECPHNTWFRHHFLVSACLYALLLFLPKPENLGDPLSPRIF